MSFDEIDKSNNLTATNSSSEKHYCNKCAVNVADLNARFCGQCGTRLTAAPVKRLDLYEWEKKIAVHLGVDNVILTRGDVNDKYNFCQTLIDEIAQVEGQLIVVRLRDNAHSRIASFRLTRMPGCCGVCISTENHIEPNYRGRKLNNLLNEFRMAVARELGYTIMLCSDVSTNTPQKKTLIKNGWKDIYQFKNKRTNNIIDLSVVEL